MGKGKGKRLRGAGRGGVVEVGVASDRFEAVKLGQKYERYATDVTGKRDEMSRAGTRETRDKKG